MCINITLHTYIHMFIYVIKELAQGVFEYIYVYAEILDTIFYTKYTWTLWHAATGTAHT